MGIQTLKTGSRTRNVMSGNTLIYPGDFESIATATGTGSSGTITFSSIPSTYTHLQIRLIGRSSSAASSTIRMRFNSDTGSNYANHMLYCDGATVYAGQNASQTSLKFYGMSYSTLTAGIMNAHILDILDYANTNKYKTLRTLGGFDANGSGEQGLYSALWMSTSAITTIDLSTDAGNWTTNSSFALYGVR